MISFAADYSMVIKQKISFAILLLATLMLMINSIIPHHHHHEEVCFVPTHCVNEEASSADHHDHHHKGVEHHHHDDDNDFCQINGFYLAPIVKLLKGQAKVLKFNKDVNSYALLNEYLIRKPVFCEDQHRIPLEDQKGLKAKFLTRALRAPPIS